MSEDGIDMFSGGGGGGSIGNTCMTFDGGYPEIESDFEAWIFNVKPNTTATLKLRFEVIADAPWVNSTYSPIITVIPPKKPRGKGRYRYDFDWPNSYKVPKGYTTPHKRVQLRAPEPVIGVPQAARIDLDLQPVTRWSRYDLTGRMKAGKRLIISGSVVPARAGLPVVLTYGRGWEGYGQVKELPLAQVVTDANGKFTFAAPPLRRNTYVFKAAYPGSPGSDLAPDDGCAVAVEVAR
ncbi:MAG: hypothetical protein ACRDKI_05510 [Solirubrobacterales bacterium]